MEPVDSHPGARGESASEAREKPRASGQIQDASIYATSIDLTDENDAHTLVIRMVGSGKRVLELGCATGSATKVFKEHACAVTAIEIDPEAAQMAKEWADEVIVADLDSLDMRAVLGDQMFDVIVAADVLEHLKDPASCLQACLEHLADEGEVVLSIPNIAHVDVRMALLRGEFEYQSCGIMDNSHLRFFTRRSLQQFLAQNGLVGLEWRRTTRPVGDTEIRWEPLMDAGIVKWASREPDADTYQFVVRAVLGPDGSHLCDVAEQRDVALAELDDVRGRLDAKDAELVSRSAELQSEAAKVAAGTHQLEELGHQLAEVTRERDEYIAAFSSLASVEDQLVAVRRSESYRLGRALLSPVVTLRRITRAWKRAKR